MVFITYITILFKVECKNQKSIILFYILLLFSFRIVEDDAFYQIRSKLFFKKGAQWQELGTGMLYLKPSGEKVQLLIRMEAVTGKVLLNINISKELPLSRSGKNNVMVVSVPNPPVFAKPADGDNSVPCTYLIRLKGTMEADELYLKLKSKF